MWYIIAFFLPPLPLFLTGQIGKGLICCILTLLGWVPGVIYAFVMINRRGTLKEMKRMMQK